MGMAPRLEYGVFHSQHDLEQGGLVVVDVFGLRPVELILFGILPFIASGRSKTRGAQSKYQELSLGN